MTLFKTGLTLIFLSFQLSLVGQTVSLIYFKELKNDVYYTGNGYHYPSSKQDGFVEIRVRILNDTKQEITFDVNEILLEGPGQARTPTLILANAALNIYKQSEVSIKAGFYIERKIIYGFNEDVRPISLLVSNKYRVNMINGKGIDKTYFDEKWQALPTSENAKYYRTSENLMGESWIVRNYYLSNNQIEMEAEAISLYPLMKNGIATWYFENGMVKEEGYFEANERKGIFYTYFNNGQKKSKIEFIDKEARHLQYWNAEADSLLVNGNGTVQTLQDNKDVSIQNFENYKTKNAFNIRAIEKDSIYDISEILPEYRGGMQGFYQYIGQNITYPKIARRSGIEGRVFVQFIVDKSGKLTEIKTIKGISTDCDQEAERVVRESKPWLPGSVDDKKVKTRMILPITYKLN